MGRRIFAIIIAALVAVLGVASVLVYANSADQRAVEAQTPTQVFVASGLVPSGTPLKDAVRQGLLTQTTVAEKGAPMGALKAVDATNESLLAVSDIQPGEYVLSSRFGSEVAGTKAISVPAGKVAVSVELGDASKVGSFVTPGSHIVLFNTYDADGGPATKVLLDDVQVIAIGVTTLTPVANTDEQAPAGSTSLVTVAVSPSQAAVLVHGIQTGRLYGALRDSDTKVDASMVVTSAVSAK